jgi:integrase
MQLVCQDAQNKCCRRDHQNECGESNAFDIAYTQMRQRATSTKTTCCTFGVWFMRAKCEVLEKEQLLPLDSVVHADLIRRIRALGDGQKWVFQSRSGTPINSGNIRRRFLHPAAAAVGVKIGGWHDFRHTLTRMMRRAGVNAVVVSGTLGHKKVELAAEVYDRASSTDIGQALHAVGKQLLPSVLPNQSVN